MRRSIRALAAVAAVPLILTAACSTSETPSGGSSSTGTVAGRGATLCKPDGTLTDVYKRPKVNSSGNVTAAVEEAVHDYNNNTATANNFANSLLSLAEPSAFLVDSNLGVCVDGDVMSSVTQASSSPLTIVYKISPDAVWSDGKPVSCHDFYLAWLASASTAKGKAGAAAFDPATTTGYDQMKAPVCSDGDKTVTTTYTTPFGDYRSLFAFMMPAHIVEAASKLKDVTKITAADGSADVQEFAANYIKLFTGFNADADVSAGPFLLKSRTDEQSVLVRNDKWWGNPAGPESVTIVTNADGQSEVQSLQNQEVQVISPQPDAALAQQLRTMADVTFVAKAGLTYEHIDFNMKLPLFQGDAGKALREATFLCVDRSDIITKLVKGVNPDTVPLGNLMFLPNEKAYVDHYADYKTADVAKAKQVMEAGGWKLGSDGVYALDGKQASFRVGHKVVDNRERITQLAGSSCAKAGIKLTDDQDVNFNAKRLPASDFDAALFAWVGTPFKSGSTSIYTTGGGANYNGYSNKKVDTLFKEGNSATDQVKAADFYNQMDAEMAKDLASIPLYQFSDMIAHTNTLSPALSYDGVSGGPFWDAFEWELKGLIAYIVRRLAVSVLLLLVASFVCFALVQALGDPIAEWAGRQRQANPGGAAEAIAAAYQRAGLDKPFLTRYFTWLGHFVQGDWGTTVNPGTTPVDVKSKILHASSITLRLILFATVLAIVVGMVTGVVTSVRQNSALDYGVTGFSFLVFSMPIFSVAVLLKLAGINLNNTLQSMGIPRWLVTAGYPPGGFSGGLGHRIFQFTGVYTLPTISLLLISFATYTRFQRASMLDIVSADYVRTARAKGLTPRRVIWVHAFRNALIPVVTVAAINMGSVISGAVITETVFGWQGMGALLVTYVNRKEPYMILAFLMVTAVFVILANLLADLAYSIIDPRIRLD